LRFFCYLCHLNISFLYFLFYDIFFSLQIITVYFKFNISYKNLIFNYFIKSNFFQYLYIFLFKKYSSFFQFLLNKFKLSFRYVSLVQVLLSHIEAHHVGSRFECPDCDYVTKTRNALRVHKSRKHRL